MRKSGFILAFAAAFSLPAWGVWAQSACGGSIMHDGDCASNPRAFAESCCNAGEVAVGLGYNDSSHEGNIQGDEMDAISVICSNASGTYFKPSDNQRYPVFYKCDPGETFVGIACKDIANDDQLDCCTPVCSRNGSRRRVYNPDCESNPRAYNEIYTNSPQKVVGVVYKDRAGKYKIGSSDRADCASIAFK